MGLEESHVGRHRDDRMKIWTLVVVFLLVIPLTCEAYESDASYERLVDEVLEVTGALKIGEQMIRFYSTKEGKKIASILPSMTQDGVVAGQQWGAVLGPQIAQRVQQRLADEGIEFP